MSFYKDHILSAYCLSTKWNYYLNGVGFLLCTPCSEIAMMLNQSAKESLKKLWSELFEMSKQRDLTDKRDVF